ncbi:bifunctional diaminohydroxyphosphoribosylaminopyrimidine deaminase/5-amino-6-(5-phosphoribosylamino)uracil reductase RibD [Nakamurella silvestris]|nr:bifunctional diaminohydroxyphosphoribosylaminopyrimidine deaminase/5-amino-6-(5-phosphoribosylamino)uracil reductase RibD [Nakamurella silvestris]
MTSTPDGPAIRDARSPMLRAIELAGRGAATVLPNPVVGCVILDVDGSVVGEGWHERYGQAHAEVNALRVAGPRARGGTAYVTLEPCNHTGRTGPCSQALIAAGVARVVVAVADPTALASGGAEVLREHGIEVEFGLEAAAAEDVNRVWLGAVRRGRPFVTWKAGMTIDGRVAALDGTSKWITSAASRADVHLLRAQVDTMVVGVGTVVADDPQLTVRDTDGIVVGPQPLRVVVDTDGRAPRGAQVFDDAAETWLATAQSVGVGPDDRVDLNALLRQLFERGQRHVLVEGGPRLATAFWDAGLVDEAIVYLAPLALGAGKPALDGGTVPTLALGHRLELRDVARFGDDVRLRYQVPGIS